MNPETVPWGVPIRSWTVGSEVSVCVVSSNPGRIDYQLKFVGRPAEEVAEAFVPRREYVGRVVDYDGGNVVVYLEETGSNIGVDAIIRYARMTPVERRNLKRSFPLGAQIRCQVEEVFPARELVSIVPTRD